MSSTGLIFNIQRFSIHDGPGIRTTVFFKGCSLQCFWCHNPEGRRARPEIQFFPERCISCGECLSACPNKCHQVAEDYHFFLRENCQACGVCSETCYANALELTGRSMTVGQVMDEILQDRLFYETSKGGVTLSGGEPVLQSGFAFELLKACKDADLHTAIETCGNYNWDKLEKLLPVADLIMMDIKHINPVLHKSFCGDSNERILANARRIALTDKPILFRTPIVPTVNDDFDDIHNIVHFIHELVELRQRISNGNNQETNIRLEFLSFHRLAGDKYRSLGMEYLAKDLDPPAKEKLSEFAKVAEIEGVEVIIQ